MKVELECESGICESENVYKNGSFEKEHRKTISKEFLASFNL